MSKFLVIKLFIIFVFSVCLNTAVIFAIEGNIIQECINNSKAAKSYHIEMYLNDLNDKRITNNNIHTIDWSIDYVNPDKFSVEQYANIENLADKWITIGDNRFAYFNAFWMEMPSESVPEQEMLRFTKSASLDKYFEILIDYQPINKSEDGDSVIINYSLNSWESFSEIWRFQDVYGCLLTMWINKRSKLIEKTLIQIYGIGKEGNKMSFGIGQKFSNYNSNIIINKPKAIKPDKIKQMRK